MRNALKKLALVALTVVGTTALAEERIELKVGDKHVITVKDLTRVALGNRETAEVKTLGGGKLEITGLEAGTTRLLTWTRGGQQGDYAVVVTDPEQAAAK
ncbi:pilus assembly protein N-terminal domain-containing protein [Myxococcus sp. MISCRS1]|jgi:Flp pilus assembly secretin CpaC|uniref:pilus assembly protein N-terminal domain-containing protein n=1 Tax=Myxococcus TaxID=32 RepID=UPI001141992B|nr:MULTISPECIES: pilus assembly protein N-terminal domain-containing protein [unclassified Myxococcus]MBZ4399225.1 pilus assembly protein N-terminal domain-containing protein [Myxococcus sp. AS-1-15]MBZ4411568.1 pilus assembly protein N-terminal domain-containing protein [Myxococcus sp. XM-1-1-1]MCY0999722.1 pilus assembly protein N-terminal domain-containing protein [Myxococcus sp. MISCRS1]BDT30407.1 pilus assembly protein N-terminal domain-containing protein [Myxococcus sp. MH1]